MNSIQIAFSNILSPAVLFFILGIFASYKKSDLEIPDSIGSAVTLYILLSIGLRGGVSVSTMGLVGILKYVLTVIFIGILITSLIYFVMSKIGFDSANAGAIAGHLGAGSSVTLTSTVVFLQQIGANFEAFVPSLYPFMDTAAIITAIVLGQGGMKKEAVKPGKNADTLKNILYNSLTGKSTVLIFGGFLIGLLSGVEGTEGLMFFYSDIFQGVFTIFMLDIGLLTGSRLHEIKHVSPATFLLAFVLPPFQAAIAILTAGLIGLSPGGATLFAALASGASIITAPVVMKETFPEANPSISLAVGLGIIFPFNIVLGIPLYYQMALIVS